MSRHSCICCGVVLWCQYFWDKLYVSWWRIALIVDLKAPAPVLEAAIFWDELWITEQIAPMLRNIFENLAVLSVPRWHFSAPCTRQLSQPWRNWSWTFLQVKCVYGHVSHMLPAFRVISLCHTCKEPEDMPVVCHTCCLSRVCCFPVQYHSTVKLISSDIQLLGSPDNLSLEESSPKTESSAFHKKNLHQWNGLISGTCS